MNKKKKIAIIGVIALVLVTIGVTYAYWLITRTQQGENVITTGCLDIALSGENDIMLNNQFPISDEDGMKLTPYRFTVTNNCNTSVDYQVALEALEAGDEISSDALKVALDNKSKLYSAYSTVDATESTAYEARKMLVGTLAPKNTEGSSKTHELRVWIDADAPISEMNKTFKSKITVTAGQGIVGSPIKEGTIAYSVLQNYGGVDAAEEIDATEYTHKVIGESTINQDHIYSLNFGTGFDYNTETGEYTLTGDIITTSDEFEEADDFLSQPENLGRYMICNVHEFHGNEGTGLCQTTKYEDGNLYINVYGYGNKFSTSSEETNIHATQDDLGTSYYFRGTPTDNYVKFGTYTTGGNVKISAVEGDTEYSTYNSLEECEADRGNGFPPSASCIKSGFGAGDSMYWRIVRINGDGTIRLVYDGTSLAENGVEHDVSVAIPGFQDDNNYTKNKSESDLTQVDSSLKASVDNWYTTHFKENYEKYLADGIFCNDRSGLDGTYYAVYRRVAVEKNPTLICQNKNDRYTVDSTLGNGYLTHPVGLLTADEILFAGDYLSDVKTFLTMSPEGSSGYFLNSGLNGFFSSEQYTRPVINLKADVEFTGNGTIDSPYEIILSSK